MISKQSLISDNCKQFCLKQVDLIRIQSNKDLDPQKKAALGQFFTTEPVSMFMASLFNSIRGDVKLLDPGCGPGSLTAAFVDETINRKTCKSLEIVACDIEKAVSPYIKESLNICSNAFKKSNKLLKSSFLLEDFILRSACDKDNLDKYTHAIINPPYKKISSTSEHRKVLKSLGIETVNLYSGFVALTIKQLQVGGELVAIIPRSFCNGPYYQPFREFMLSHAAIRHIHIFDNRSEAFSSDNVLQENIIIHLVKEKQRPKVAITSSPGANFHIDDKTGIITVTDMTERMVPFTSIVSPKDKQKFIHIVANHRDQTIVDHVGLFTSTLLDIGVEVSTGPVVDFRLKDDLRENIEHRAVPLIYSIHLDKKVNWPKSSKKPNAIAVSNNSKKWLWKNEGNFIIVRRFSTKEEKRRIVATYYDGNLPEKFIGFDNKLNIYHCKKNGLEKDLALGLYIYLNSTLLDKYYRLFGGHTQVNATDLRSIHYPSIDTLRQLGKQVNDLQIETVRY